MSVPQPAPGDDLEVLEDAVRRMLEVLDPDSAREGLDGTPRRVARAMLDLTDGYGTDPRSVVRGALYAHEGTDTVLVRDIPFYSLCDHHLLPMFGRCHIGYVPSGTIVGISKLPRLVGLFAHRLQMQERLTSEIACAIQDVVSARGVGVVTEARHLCVEMRGVEKGASVTVASSLLGVYRTDDRLRAELMAAVGRAAA